MTIIIILAIVAALLYHTFCFAAAMSEISQLSNRVLDLELQARRDRHLPSTREALGAAPWKTGDTDASGI